MKTNNKLFRPITVKLLILFLVASIFVVPLAEATEDCWTSKTSMQEARSNLGVATVNGKIYAIGGLLEDYTFSNTNEQYDPATDMWTFKTPMPTSRTNLAVTAYGNKIYCIGGVTSAIEEPAISFISEKNEAYDPISDTWETMKPIPTPRYDLQASVVNGKIFVTGGITNIEGTSHSNVTEVYDPETNTWETLAQMPNASSASASVVVDNKLYVIGGTTIRIYDLEMNTWILGTPSPLPAIYAVAGATTDVFDSERIYVFGADAEQSPLWRLTLENYTAQSYEPSTDKWTKCTLMPSERMFSGVAVVDNKLFVIGGVTLEESDGSFFPTTIPSAINEQYNPNEDVLVDDIPEFSSWVLLPLFLVGCLAVFCLRRKMEQ